MRNLVWLFPVSSRGVRIATLALGYALASTALASEPPGGLRCRQGVIERADVRFDTLVAPEAKLECIADGYRWVEGPVWDARRRTLFFTDIPSNRVLKWRRGGPAEAFLERAGYAGMETFPGREPGANGLAIDAAGRLLLCEHGERRITRLEVDGSRTVLADRFEGKRLNSPNDLVIARDGAVYFTDPPFGLPRTYDDPARELDFAGVFVRWPSGALELLLGSVPAPNGVALSPDERTLYVSNASRRLPRVFAYSLVEGTVPDPEGRVFFDAAPWLAGPEGAGAGVPDGLAVDAAGNVFVAGPGGVHVLASDGSRLGRIGIEARTSNVAIGEAGRALYITADTSVYRISLVEP